MSEHTNERMLTLKEIIRLTGHRSTAAAYGMLHRRGKAPDGFRRSSRAPQAVWRESVVRAVFASHLDRVRRIRAIPDEKVKNPL